MPSRLPFVCSRVLSKFFFLCLLLSGALLAKAQQQFANEESITASRLKAHLEFIASDEMEGRDTPSRGLDIATLYVATQLKLWGAVPAGDNGTFFQNVSMGQRSLLVNESAIDFGGKYYEFGKGFQSATKDLKTTAKLVYVGHVFVIKGMNIDPYAGLDVKGKILVVASGLPKGVSKSDVVGGDETVVSPERAAQKFGAIGILTSPDQDYKNRWTVVSGMKMGGLSLKDDPALATAIPNIVAGPDLSRAIFQSEAVSAEEVESGGDAPEKGFYFGDQKLAGINIVSSTAFSSARNVVAIVPGSDERLSAEYVAYGAHIDHFGIGSAGGDRIFNGADDDGSGTVSILEIAHAYLSGRRPKRSSLFVWHVGEEKGLIGSAFFTAHPTVNLSNVITQLNIDMIGRSRKPDDRNPANNLLSGANEIYVVGSTKMSSDLQRISESVNRSYLNLTFNYRYDDPRDTDRVFYRSDHYNYALKGIPIIFYFDGAHEDYHRVSDEVSKIDFEKMSRIARTIYATGWALANADTRPVVDRRAG